MSTASPSSRKSPALPARWIRAARWLFAALWCAALLPLLPWGLPDRSRDELLFGGAPPWPAERYRAAEALAERQARSAGADTDLNPLTERDQIASLTTDEADRAELLRRYRLFSRQPDEMITFMALQRMRPRAWDFDPKLYQYGGGFIYPVGASLRVTALLGFVELRSDAGFYLEHPEEFGRFYLVARFLVLLTGGLLLVAVWKLAERCGAGPLGGFAAALLLAATPVLLSGALEAKPHVPSACLLVWATLSALDYLRDGRRWAILRMGLQSGYAFGLVLTGLMGVALWPALWWAQRRSRDQQQPRPRPRRLLDLALAAALFAAVFLLTNPYLPYNVLFNRPSLESNFGNSLAMYADQVQQAGRGALRVAVLLFESAGALLPALGLVALVVAVSVRPRKTLLVTSTGLAMLALAILLGADKPAEYARFLILPVALLCVGNGLLLSWLRRRAALLAGMLLVLLLLTTNPLDYLRSFYQDARGTNETRRQAAEYLEQQLAPAEPLAVIQEPAPYAVPPVDFAHREVIWLPPVAPLQLDPAKLPAWLVFTADTDDTHASAWWQRHYALQKRFPPPDLGLSPITWANKAVYVYRRTPVE